MRTLIFLIAPLCFCGFLCPVRLFTTFFALFIQSNSVSVCVHSLERPYVCLWAPVLRGMCECMDVYVVGRCECVPHTAHTQRGSRFALNAALKLSGTGEEHRVRAAYFPIRNAPSRVRSQMAHDSIHMHALSRSRSRAHTGRGTDCQPKALEKETAHRRKNSPPIRSRRSQPDRVCTYAGSSFCCPCSLSVARVRRAYPCIRMHAMYRATHQRCSRAPVCVCVRAPI